MDLEIYYMNKTVHDIFRKFLLWNLSKFPKINNLILYINFNLRRKKNDTSYLNSLIVLKCFSFLGSKLNKKFSKGSIRHQNRVVLSCKLNNRNSKNLLLFLKHVYFVTSYNRLFVLSFGFLSSGGNLALPQINELGLDLYNFLDWLHYIQLRFVFKNLLRKLGSKSLSVIFSSFSYSFLE